MARLDKSELMYQVMDRYGVRYRNTTGWQSVHCPSEFHVHGDRNPSGRLNLGVGGYFCHGCDMKGSAYDVVMFMEGVDFKQAVKQLGEPYNPVESDYLI